MDDYARFRVTFESIYLHKTLTFNFRFLNDTGFINIALENSTLKTEHESEPETKL